MTGQTLLNIINQLSFDLPAFFVAILIHEYSHVVAARRLTDQEKPEIAEAGFKPLDHLDFFGTMLPVCLIISGFPIIFGWGKRINATFSSNQPRVRAGVFAAAGIIGNLMLCLLSGLLISSIPASEFLFDLAAQPSGVFVYTFIFRIFSISLALILVNLLPIPPFDGGYLLFALIPEKYRKWQERVQLLGLLITVTLIVTGIAGYIFIFPYKSLTEAFCGGFSAYVLQPGSLATDFLRQ